MISEENLYCFEIAISSINFNASNVAQSINLPCLSFQFLRFPQVILIPKIGQSEEGISSCGKACYFTIDSNRLFQEIKENGFLSLSIVDYTLPKSLAIAKIRLKKPDSVAEIDNLSESGIVQLKSETGQLFADMKIGLRLSKVGERVNHEPQTVDKLLANQTVQTDEFAVKDPTETELSTVAIQTFKRGNKAKQCQTVALRKRSEMTQTHQEEALQSVQRTQNSLDMLEEHNHQEADFLSAMLNAFLKIDIGKSSSFGNGNRKDYPFLSCLAKELASLSDQTTRHTKFAQKKRSTTVSAGYSNLGPYMGLIDWSSPVSKNLYSRIYGSKSFGYATNKTAILRTQFGKLSQTPSQGYTTQQQQKSTIRPGFLKKIYLKDASTTCDDLTDHPIVMPHQQFRAEEAIQTNIESAKSSNYTQTSPLLRNQHDHTVYRRVFRNFNYVIVMDLASLSI